MIPSGSKMSSIVRLSGILMSLCLYNNCYLKNSPTSINDLNLQLKFQTHISHHKSRTASRIPDQPQSYKEIKAIRVPLCLNSRLITYPEDHGSSRYPRSYHDGPPSFRTPRSTSARTRSSTYQTPPISIPRARVESN